MKKVMAFLSGVAIFQGAMAEPVDGIYYFTHATDGNTMRACYWRDTTIAGDGGVATMDASGVSTKFTNGLVDWQLGGLDLKLLGNNIPFEGNDITFVGATPFISSAAQYGPKMQMTLKGTGENTLVVKSGNNSAVGSAGGAIQLEKSLANFGKVRLEHGLVRALTDAAPVANTVATLAFAGGSLETGANKVHDMSSTALALEAGGGDYRLGSGAQVAFKSAAAAVGSALAVVPAAGLSALGETTKLTVGTGPGVQSCGITDPRFVGLDPTANGAFSFLAYDATKGFVKFPDASLVDIASATANDVAKVTPDGDGKASVAGGKTVGALVIKTPAAVTLDGTLTIGNGMDPAGVILQAASSATETTLTGGTLDFGTSHGVLWGGSSASPELGVQIGSTLAGSAGLTFASRPTGKDNTFVWLMKTPAGWTGPTHVDGSSLLIRSASHLPVGGDVYIGRSAQLLLSGNLTLDQHLHVKGYGGYYSKCLCGDNTRKDTLGAVWTDFTSATFNGPITLEDDADFYLRGGNFAINGVVSGPGRLRIFSTNRPVSISGANQGWTGGLKLTEYGSTTGPQVTLQPTGSLGSGPIDLGTGSLTVTSRTERLALHDVTTAANGAVTVEAAPVDFVGTSSIAFASFDTDTLSNACSTVGVDDTLSLAKVNWFNNGGSGKFVARTANSTLRLGGAEDFSLSAGLNDGEGKLTLVKTGADTVTLVNSKSGTRDFTGGIRVEEGTLRVEGDVLASPGSLDYWLDASDKSTLVLGEGNRVTRWNSKVGSAYFTKNSDRNEPVWVDAGNGLGSVCYPADENCSLIGDKAYPHKTVFVVYKVSPEDLAAMTPETEKAFVPIFCAATGEATLRIPAQAGAKTATFENYFNNAYFLNMHAYLTVNGGSNMSVGVGDSFNVVGAAHVMDGYDSHTPVKLGVTTFRPVAGASGSGKHFHGQISEILAFNRLLTDAEYKTVENYLTKKWRGAAVHASVGAQPSVLPANVDVEVAHGAVLDVHGTDLSLGNLTGGGTITNSSTKAATVRVTGGSFSGKVVGPVTLVSEGGTFGLSLEGEASLALAGGTTALKPYNLKPPTAHLAYWLDATAGTTFTKDATTGKVSNWASKEPSVVPAFAQSTSTKQPTYQANAFGTLAGVSFESGNQMLGTVKDVTRTMFLVFKADTAKMGQYLTLWGTTGARCLRTEGGALINPPGRLQYWMNGGCLRVNGVDNSTAVYKFVDGQTTLFTVRIDDTHPDDELDYQDANAFDAQNKLGTLAHTAGELIAYTNRLDDGQMLAVEQYLMEKWSIAGHTPATVNDKVMNGTGSVAVSGEATLDGDFELNGPLVLKTVGAKGEATVNPFAVTGALTLGPLATLTVDDFTWLNRKRSCDGRYRLVDAAGGVTGSFKSTNLDGNKKWDLVKDVRGWVAVAIRGLMAIVR